MPSEDFRFMSDQELSDVVVYIRSHPPVDAEVPAPTFGPLGKLLVATGQLPFPYSLIDTHDEPHRVLPPVAEVSVEFGAHIAATCTGCHGHDLSGGPIVGGDPSWPPARNLTPHPSALGSWTYSDFVTAMQQGVRPDGSSIVPHDAHHAVRVADDRRRVAGALDVFAIADAGCAGDVTVGRRCMSVAPEPPPGWMRASSRAGRHDVFEPRSR